VAPNAYGFISSREDRRIEHAVVGLEREATEVEGHAFADEHDAAARAGRLPREVDESGAPRRCPEHTPLGFVVSALTIGGLAFEMVQF
jgi:hypothetical protein